MWSAGVVWEAAGTAGSTSAARQGGSKSGEPGAVVGAGTAGAGATGPPQSHAPQSQDDRGAGSRLLSQHPFTGFAVTAQHDIAQQGAAGAGTGRC